MLLTIKSSYFLNDVFAYINDGRKLKLFIHSKSHQEKLALNFVNYKYFSGKYIIVKEGKAKEFDRFDDHLLFEGEYLNGEKNGKGKEYDKYQKVIFEGTYLNKKRHGKGKEYDSHSYKLIFEGEYLNGKRWNGKGFTLFHSISYLKN